MADLLAQPLKRMPARPALWPRLAGRRAGWAGALAALVMLAAQLVWRLTWADSGVQSFP